MKYEYDRVILGYHGCDAATADALLAGRAALRPSLNDYDWLGNGVYFWEYGPERAWEFAKEQASRGTITRPAVVGAVIQLGVCFNMLDSRHTADLRNAFSRFKAFVRQNGLALPRNTGRTPDRLLRRRDCAMLNWYLDVLAGRGRHHDTVRCAFREGSPAFPGSGIASKTHVQIAVRNLDCVIGVFRPRMKEDPHAQGHHD